MRGNPEGARGVDGVETQWRAVSEGEVGPESMRPCPRELREWIRRVHTALPAEYCYFALYPLLEDVLHEARVLAEDRSIHMVLEDEVRDLKVLGNQAALRCAVRALLRNGIENTPDGSLIRIAPGIENSRPVLRITDYGVGITREKRKYVFDGFFNMARAGSHDRGKPYSFGAQGRGLTLLRLKIYSERYGFDLLMKSERCMFLAGVGHTCTGSIERCPFCTTILDCIKSGGTTFSLVFAKGRFA